MNEPLANPVRESELIRDILRGKRSLFHDLIKPYERAVYVAAYGIARNHEDAEEISQEAMLKAFRNLEQLHETEKFKAWLLRITVNEARMRRRKRRDHLFESLDGEGNQEINPMPRDFADWREIPSESLEKKEVRQLVAAALRDLPPIYREIFLLRDVQQLSVADCAAMLEISRESVKVRLHRARLMIRERLVPAFRMGFIERWLPFKGRKPW